MCEDVCVCVLGPLGPCSYFSPFFGGLINIYSEIKGFSREKALERTKNIYNITLEILNKSEEDGITTNEAAISIAEQRLENYSKR